MQHPEHPDEGTIHSWLDGALSGEEAERVESHVTECASCAAAVAEARGFIAASSRILTALDDVPRGVIPAVPRQTRDMRVFWRAAAAMLVVAGGSLVVMREGGQDTQLSERGSEATTLSAPTTNPSEARSGTIDVTATNGAAERTTDRATVGRVESAASQRSATVSAPQIGKGTAANDRDLSLRAERRSGDEAKEAARGTIAADAIAAPTAAPVMEGTVFSPSTEPAKLKVLNVERAIGSRRTTYEVAPSQTVVLTEYMPLQLEAVVVGGAGRTVQRQAPTSGTRTVKPTRVEAAPAAQPPPPQMRDSRSAADSTNTANQAAAVAKTSSGQIQSGAAFVATTNSISWKDAATGNTLTLSGRLPVERLQEIRRQIEKEREAVRKSP